MLAFLLLLAGCSSSSSDGDLACGPLTCTDAEVCVEEAFEPACTNKADTGEACPEGTTDTRCGGAGIPCCCEPTPEPGYQCWDASACGDTPTCDCVDAACPDGKECVSLGSETSGVFSCQAPPVP